MRAERTLVLMHGWGYAPTLGALAEQLLGGSTNSHELAERLRGQERFSMQYGHVCLRGREGLLSISRDRVASNRSLNGNAREIAREYATRLAELCPFLECISLSGSVASGGYQHGDDIDLNVFVKDGTKYIVYVFALALGFMTTLRYRSSYGFRKIICINVLWSKNQSLPFERRDEGLAFELIRSEPLLGADHFRRVIQANPWISDHFPQIRDRIFPEVTLPPPSRFGRALLRLILHPRALAFANMAGRQLAFFIYSVVHAVRNRNLAAKARFEFLQRVKFPYEVFQD